jgi:hypothetical protein
MAKTVKEVLALFNDTIGIDKDRMFAELEKLAGKLGLDMGSETTAAFEKQARALYDAYVTPEVLNQIKATGFAELLALWKTGRVPKRRRRVGAATA